MKQDLINCPITSTPFFSLDGIKSYCKLVNIYDGDTITCILPIFDTFYKFIVRLNGIDTAEIKTKNEDIKHMALEAKNRVIQLTTNKSFDTNNQLKEYLENNPIILWIHCHKFDKYGRVLSDVFINPNDKLSISEILLNEKLAVSYDGKTKTLLY